MIIITKGAQHYKLWFPAQRQLIQVIKILYALVSVQESVYRLVNVSVIASVIKIFMGKIAM